MLVFQEKSYGSPMVIDAPMLKFTPENFQKFHIQLENLHLDTPVLSPIVPLEESTIPNPYHTPSLWTITLYIGLLVAVILFFLKRKKLCRKRTVADTEDPTLQDVPLQPRCQRLNLPGDASFWEGRSYILHPSANQAITTLDHPRLQTQHNPFSHR